MSIKLTKKQLKDLAKSLNGINLKGNRYSYDNDLCDLMRLKHELTRDLKDLGYEFADVVEVAYSIGMYGVNGFIHQVAVYQETNRIVLFYVYF